MKLPIYRDALTHTADLLETTREALMPAEFRVTVHYLSRDRAARVYGDEHCWQATITTEASCADCHYTHETAWFKGSGDTAEDALTDALAAMVEHVKRELQELERNR